MIVSSATVEAGSHIAADLVIVGAGAVGITIAKRLSGTKLKVLLLESGGYEPDEATQALYEGVIAGQQTDPTDASRLRFFGGTTNHWAGWCRPLEESDFQKRADWPESGWPITRADLDPYYRDAALLCQVIPAQFDDMGFWQRQKGGQILKPLALDAGKLRTTLIQCSPPTHFGEAYRADLEKAQNVRVLLNANVMELLPGTPGRKSKASKAVGKIVVRKQDGKSFTVAGRAVVLAQGGIESARLMLLSDKVHPSGAGNENDMVGRYFMDHPLLSNASYVRFAQAGDSRPLYFKMPNKVGSGQVFGFLTPPPALLAKERISAFRLIMRPSWTSTDGADSIRALTDSLKHGRFPDHLGEHLGNIFSDIDVLADSAYKTVTKSREGFLSEDKNKPARGAWVDLNFEQRPNRDSRVTLDSSRDALGQRRLKLEWRLSETDRRTAMRALDIAAHEFSRAGLGRSRVRLDVSGSKPWPWEMRGSNHHSGTARMSADPKTGVVDADCRVHTLDNLYVGGSAVFPTQGYMNPTLTIVALAARLSDHLQKVLA